MLIPARRHRRRRQPLVYVGAHHNLAATPISTSESKSYVDGQLKEGRESISRLMKTQSCCHTCLYAGRTIEATFKDIPEGSVDEVIVVDSSLTEELIRPIARERFDIMFGGRVRTRQEALAGGMPKIKYFVNRTVSLIENIVLGVNFTEHMSGFRAYSSRVLKTLPFENFSDDFVFDQQFMISAIAYGFRIAEYTVPVRYFSEASSIRYLKGAKFLFHTFVCLGRYVAYRWQVYRAKIFTYKSV